MKDTILIVDDSEIARILLKSNFNKRYPSINTLLAENAEQARSILDKHSIALITIDLNMPDSNGLDLAIEIKQKGFDHPIVIITANIQNSVKFKVEKSGFYFLEKPIGKNTVDKIISILEKK